jgi:hypothetical protein
VRFLIGVLLPRFEKIYRGFIAALSGEYRSYGFWPEPKNFVEKFTELRPRRRLIKKVETAECQRRLPEWRTTSVGVVRSLTAVGWVIIRVVMLALLFAAQFAKAIIEWERRS